MKNKRVRESNRFAFYDALFLDSKIFPKIYKFMSRLKLISKCQSEIRIKSLK